MDLPNLFGSDDPLFSTTLVAGIDEAGRGPLAGPVCAAAVILDPNRPIEGLNDSKKLTAKKREALAPLIKERALAWCIAWATVEEIDSLNILQATMLAMTRAVEGLQVKPELILVDGNRTPKNLPAPASAIVKETPKSQPLLRHRSWLKQREMRRWLSLMRCIQGTGLLSTRAMAQHNTWQR